MFCSGSQNLVGPGVMAVAIGLAEMPLQPLNQRACGLARSIVDLVGLAQTGLEFSPA